MECSCIRQTELPGTSRLFADFTYHPDRVAQFYPWATKGAAAFPEVAARIDFPDSRRAALIELLREQNGSSPLLDRLGRPGTVAVVTGQQVGFLSGPAYTIYKALTAVRLAERLTENGIEAVPVFWLATEDHDFAEVNHAWVYDHDHQPSRLECIASPVPNQPVGGIALDGFDWDALATALNGLPFTDQVLDLAKNAYRPGVSMGQSFRELTSALLGRHQLLYVDPMAESVRRMAAPLMRDAIAKGKLLKKKLLERNKELTAAGYHAQVHVDEHNTLAFLLEDGRRLSLRRPNDHYVVGGRLISVADMQNQAEHLSPNALLRPVVQDYILPTIAYIGGPAELAYLAQSEVLYRELLGRQPVALHRTGFTLLDARSQKLMNRYGICLPDFFHGEHELKERIAARLIPQELKVLVSRTRETAVQAIHNLTGELDRFDPTLAKASARSRRKIEHQIQKLESKVAREILVKDEIAARSAASLNGLLYPHKHLQERLYSILPMVAEHGLELIGRLYDHVQLDCPDHRLITV
jgi:bacillithiol biosynthesis cysteine-adding enzyme BshC